MGATVIGAGTGALVRRLDAFATSGTWTAPAGVTYVIARLRGGGGGAGNQANNTGTNGGSTSAFGFTANGGAGGRSISANGSSNYTLGHSALTTSEGGKSATVRNNSNEIASGVDGDYGDDISVGVAVTPGQSYSITIGAGGTGGYAGGNGRVEIDYEVAA